MTVEAKIIIEAPHAKETLIRLIQFKDFTFRSKHLILHTRKSLFQYLKNSGFKNISVDGYQRYRLANYQNLLIKGKSGNHRKWAFLRYPIRKNI